MKKIIFSALALLGMGTMANAQFSVYKDGKVVFTMPETPDYVDFTYNAPTTGTENGHDWVDLGLSVKWATCNVGASKPEEYGDYYAWGETETKDNYSWSTYKFQAEFIGDNKITLEKEDDAAAVNWGGDWAMPSLDDFSELEQYCTCTWTTQYGVKGYKITGSNGNSIFLPAAGLRGSGGLVNEGSRGYYWSSLLYEKSHIGRYLYFREGVFSPWSGNASHRCYGQSVRPVCPSAGNTNGHVSVDLGLPSGKLWAECNVGASTPEASGDYFAWGETEAKSDYSWSTYKHMQEGKSEWYFVNKYQAQDGNCESSWYRFEKYSSIDNMTILEKADDAATANWGDNWRIPTAAEWEELYNNTTQKWTNNYEGTGVKGHILTCTKEGHEGASIFLPAAGYRGDGNLNSVGNYGFYWSRSLSADDSYDAYELNLFSNGVRSGGSHRCYGQSVRPVCQK